MTVLVTRPQPDADRTAEALRKRGYAALVAPMLSFAPLPFPEDGEMNYSGILVTSANALRGLEGQAALKRLLALPVMAVGARTAQAARDAGFADVTSANGDAAALKALAAKHKIPRDPLLYLAGADLAHDLAGALGAKGFSVVTHTTYRMIAAKRLPDEAIATISDGRIEAVLHYSRRSARAFAASAAASGVEATALALRQCCLSDAVATVIRDAGAGSVSVAQRPDETALFAVLERAIGARSG